GARFGLRSIRKEKGAGRHRGGEWFVLFGGYADGAARARGATADRRRRPPICRGWLVRILRHRPTRELSAWGQLRRPDSEGRQGGRSAHPGPHPERAYAQPSDPP